MSLALNYRRARIYLKKHGVAATAGEVARRVGRRIIRGGLPAGVHVEISNVCNLHCEYCVLDQGAQGDRVMSDETLARVLPYLAGARRVDVSGLAEPLMNVRWARMIDRIREATPRGYIAMCSNATLLDEAKCRQLVKSGADELVFSLDGVDPGQVDRVRQGGSLTDMLDNLATLQRVKAQMGSDKPELVATVVLQRSNCEQLPAIVRLAAEIGADSVNVNGLEPYTEALVPEVVWNDPERFAYLPGVLRELKQAADETGLSVRMTAMQPTRPVCPQIHRPIVLADGTVVPCSVLAYERRSLLSVDERLHVVQREATTPRVTFGNVKDSDFKAIWMSEQYRAFRSAVASGHFPPSCATCLLKHDVICPTPPLTINECLATLATSAQAGAH